MIYRHAPLLADESRPASRFFDISAISLPHFFSIIFFICHGDIHTPPLLPRAQLIFITTLSYDIIMRFAILLFHIVTGWHCFCFFHIIATLLMPAYVFVMPDAITDALRATFIIVIAGPIFIIIDIIIILILFSPVMIRRRRYYFSSCYDWHYWIFTLCSRLPTCCLRAVIFSLRFFWLILLIYAAAFWLFITPAAITPRY